MQLDATIFAHIYLIGVINSPIVWLHLHRNGKSLTKFISRENKMASSHFNKGAPLLEISTWAFIRKLFFGCILYICNAVYLAERID